MTQLKGKRAIVTGASRGIGRAIATEFLARGATVLACGRGDRPMDLDGGIDWVRADVSAAADVAQLADAARQRFETVDVLVNNAGIQIEKTVADTTDEDWAALMGVNAYGVFAMCRAFVPMMQGGSIINIGSISGNVADGGLALYNASKAFVHGLTRSIAVDHGNDGVR